ncbi:Uncharacterised protein [Vibrio cholerae]|nr:Uncharacterised protein [Vibrio cholerae]
MLTLALAAKSPCRADDRLRLTPTSLRGSTSIHFGLNRTNAPWLPPEYSGSQPAHFAAQSYLPHRTSRACSVLTAYQPE